MDSYPTLSLEDLVDFGEDPISNVEVQSSGWVDQLNPEGTHVGHTDGLTPGIIKHDFGIPQVDDQDLDYGNFAKWIPRYSKPQNPCERCRLQQLDCWFTYENQTGCSACNALFRPCSFIVEPNPQVLMATLHVVQEDTVQSTGELTGVKALRSWDRTPLDHPDMVDEERPSRRGSGTRFSRDVIKVMKHWVEAHANHPYPSEEEKEELASLTNLSVAQVANWFANTRRRNKKKYTRGVSPSIRSPTWPAGTEAIPIPANKRGIMHDGKTWDAMNPMDRWKISPPENEPAPVSAIARAVAESRLSGESSISRSNSRQNINSSASGSFSGHRAPSITSLETGQSESHQSSGSFSNNSLNSSRSHGSRNSLHSYSSGHRKDRRRRKRAVITSSRTLGPADKRPFHCTFCTDSFRTKYDWMRHEKSLHLSLEKWICAPLGNIITNPATGERVCVYCEEVNPSQEHLETHNHETCEEKGMAGRTFYRKDHLRQHLRLVHGCQMVKSMDTWKSEAQYIKCRCGFCGAEFTSWNERCDHLAKHFRGGATMREWKGCRGFDAEVAAYVTHAMPPFLIGNEATSMVPFSASNEASMGMRDAPTGTITAGIPTTQQGVGNGVGWIPNLDSLSMPASGYTFNAIEGMTFPDQTRHDPLYNRPRPKISTCWEILTLRLGMYVNEQMQAGILPTNQMLQAQARWILYENDDDWNQTAADNPEWLELFKKAHGLPNVATDSRVDLTEDLGVIGDLSFDALTFQDTSWDLLPGMTTTAGDMDMTTATDIMMVTTTAGDVNVTSNMVHLYNLGVSFGQLADGTGVSTG